MSEDKFSEFIIFGHIGDQKFRRGLIIYLNDKIDSSNESREDLIDSRNKLSSGQKLATKGRMGTLRGLPSFGGRMGNVPVPSITSVSGLRRIQGNQGAIREMVNIPGLNYMGDSIEVGQAVKFIDSFISDKKILGMINFNEDIRNDIAKRIVDTIDESYYNFKKNNEYFDEELCYKRISNYDVEYFFKNFAKILSVIVGFNPNKRYKFKFLEKEYERLKNEDITEEKKTAFRNQVMNRWEKILEEKKLKTLMKIFDDARKNLLKELYEQIDKFRRLQRILDPFLGMVGRLWGLARGLWHKTGFDILERYTEILENEEKIQKLAEMLGRMSEAEEELEKRIIKETEIRPRYEIIHAGKSEFVGIHESNDINNLLPSEVVMLSDPDTELIFYKKFAEKKLLTYQLRGYDLKNYEYEKEKLEDVSKSKEKKGPIIICVDTSGSMTGLPELVAKTLAFAVLRIALMEKRRCFLISFSISIKTIELTDLKENFDKLINFLTFSFHGGTNATPALREAVKQLRTEKYRNADVLMISDFILGRLPKELEKEILEMKKNKTKFHSLIISTYPNVKALKIFDNNWVYNTNNIDKSYISVLKNIRYL
ncbi:MAG: VWA domain-containing protein [Candidatus Helarchaeota archaeon]